MARAINSALAHARLLPEQVGYFDAHGTGTEANDAAEWRAIKLVFGDHAQRLPVSATKSYFGHTLGAAGIIELAAAMLALRHGLLPATLNFTTKRAFAPTTLVTTEQPRHCEQPYMVTHNAAFGGANTTLAIGPAPAPRPAASPATAEPVVVIGWGVLGVHGSEDLQQHLRGSAPPDSNSANPSELRIAEETLRRALRGVDARGFDRCSKLLTAAANLALLDAKVRVRGPLRDRIGIMVGANRLPWDSADSFWGATRARGLDRASAPAFSRIVMNAAAGACSRALSLRGPLSVLAEGLGGSLRAALLGTEMLAHRSDLDLLLIGSVFELGPGMCEDLAFQRLHGPKPPAGETAAVVLLARRSFAQEHELQARALIAAAALGGPADPATSLQQCLASARCTTTQVDTVYLAGFDEGPEALDHAVLQRVFGDDLQRVAIHRPAAVLGGSEAMDAVALAAACQSVCGPLRAHSATACRDSASRASSRRALIYAANELTGSSTVLVQTAV